MQTRETALEQTKNPFIGVSRGKTQGAPTEGKTRKTSKTNSFTGERTLLEQAQLDLVREWTSLAQQGRQPLLPGSGVWMQGAGVSPLGSEAQLQGLEAQLQRSKAWLW